VVEQNLGVARIFAGNQLCTFKRLDSAKSDIF
jgi:hypothetical protein